MRHSDKFLVIAFTVLALVLSSPSAAAKRLTVDDWVLSSRSAGLAMQGDAGDARETAARIDRLDIRDHAYARMAVIFARNDDGEAALSVLTRISDKGRRSDATVEVGIGLARRGRLAAAEKLAAALDPQRRDMIRAVISMVQAEQGAIRDFWMTAHKSNDLSRLRESLALFHGGLARSIKPKAAIDAALRTKPLRIRVLSLLAIARSLVLNGKPQPAMLALTWARQEARGGNSNTALRSQVAADTAMILLRAGDIKGAELAAEEIANKTLQKFLLHHIGEAQKFTP